MIIIIHTDDCLLYAQGTKYIDYLVKTLRDDYKVTLNDRYPIDDFLGIHFSHQDNGELHMIQTGLIDAVTDTILIRHLEHTVNSIYMQQRISSDRSRMTKIREYIP
jgi:hypothetical protein